MGRVAECSGVLLVLAAGLFSIGATQRPGAPLANSALPVTLLGVAMDATTPARSACLVRCTYPGQTQPTSVLRATGQRVCDVAEITEILQETVVIRNLVTNQLELLTFPRSGAVPGTTMARAIESVPTTPDIVPPSDVVSIEVRRDAMHHYLENLPELLSSAVATPHYRDAGNGQSTIEGIEINRIKEGSAAGQLGLHNGDVVLEVNGDKLDSAASIVRLLAQAQAMAPQATLIVSRNGKKLTVVVNMK